MFSTRRFVVPSTMKRRSFFRRDFHSKILAAIDPQI
jgi:hypothetical protein